MYHLDIFVYMDKVLNKIYPLAVVYNGYFIYRSRNIIYVKIPFIDLLTDDIGVFL